MASLATRRFIDAAAKLDPADRALLNLWLNRGLDDERLTALTGMSVDALQARREKIVAQLAAELGLPGEDVRGALEQISPDDEALTPPGVNGTSDAAPAGNGATTLTELADGPPPTDAAPPQWRRRRWLWLGIVALTVIGAGVIAIVAGGRSSMPPPRRAASTDTPTTATQTPTVATPAHPFGAPVPVPFVGLPGGLMHASGSVKLSGPVTHLRLNLTVRGLPLAHAGYYEIWLYNSVLDSQPLGRLRNGKYGLKAALPARARHYRWIDISFQPVGVVNHSGESELRASNPAHTTMARLRTASARARHPLRQASPVSAAHPARNRGRHGSRPARRRAAAHRLKRSARGSRRAKTSK